MSLLEALAIAVAGVYAGAINAVVGSGTLITFPVLLALGYPPLIANMSNNVGLVPGQLSGSFGYRRELAGQGSRIRRLAVGATLGACAGAALLMTLPSSAFEAIVPVFIALALVTVVFGERVRGWVEAHRSPHPHGGVAVLVTVFLLGIYGGFFGAAQGILLVASLGLLLGDTLQRTNALKNVLTVFVNGAAALAFIVFGTVDWGVVALIAGGATVGGQLGSTIGRRLPDPVLRAVIIAVGCFAIAKLLID